MIPRFFLSAALLLAGVTVALGGGPHPSLPPPIIPDCLGVNIHFTDPKPGELRMLAAAGFKWVRMDFGWAGTERKRGEYDFSAYDSLVANLDKHKIRAVFVLDYGNPLYAESGDKHPFTARANTAEFRDAFARWARAAVQHFAGRGYLWEMWNEPNEEQFWKSPSGREDYIALAKATGEALRAAKRLGEKGEAFIGPATSTIDQPFLEACFQAGLLEFWDAVSVHPHRQTEPETVEEEYRAVRLLIRKYAPKDKAIPIISGAWGYSSAGKDFDKQKQAENLPRQFLTNIANDVVLSVWRDWRDDGTDSQNPEHRFGLVAHEYHPDRNSVYDPKPAYQAMKTLTEQLRGFRFNKSLVFNVELSQHDRVLLFEAADEVRLVAWSVGNTGNVIELPASRDAMMVVRTDGAMTEQKAEQDGNLFGIKYRPGSDPSYLWFQKPNDLLRIAAAVTRLPLELVFDTPGQSPQFSVGFKNLLPIPLSARFGTPDRFGGFLLSARTDTQKQIVTAGTRFEKRFATQSSSREANGVPLMLGIEIAPSLETHINENVAIYQNVILAPFLPIRVSRLPGPAEEVVLKIENPAGQFWKGTVCAFAAGWKGGKRAVSEKIDLTLPQDLAEVVAHIPLIKEERRDISWIRVIGVSLTSPNGSTCHIPVPDTRIVKLDVTNVEILPDGDSKAETVPVASAEPPADGAVGKSLSTLRLKYSFSAARKFYRVINPSWPPPDETGLIENPMFLGLWVYGDGQGCLPRIRFMDSTGQTFQSTGSKIDWKGWRQVFFPMRSTPEKPLECWGGEGDGKIRYPIEIGSIFLLENVSREKMEGEIFISAPTLIY